MVLMVLDEAEEAARRERIVRGDRAEGTLLLTDDNEEKKDILSNSNNDQCKLETKNRDVIDEPAEVVGKHVDVIAAVKGRVEDWGGNEASSEGMKPNKTIEILVSAYEDEGNLAARGDRAWDAEEQAASEPVVSLGSMDRGIRKSENSVPRENKDANMILENAHLAEAGERQKKTHRRRLSLVSTQCSDDGQLQPAVLLSLNDVIDRHCLSPLVLKSPMIPFGGLMDDSFAHAMIQAEKEDISEKEVEEENTACCDVASNRCSAGQKQIEHQDNEEECDVADCWNDDESHGKETSIPLHVYEADIARMEEDFEKRMKRLEGRWEQRYEQMQAEKETSEKRIESLIRQSKVLEETSTSLGSQVMYLRSKLEKTEAKLSEANTEVHVARMNGQTKLTTIENLTQQIQTTTMENCRLSKDKMSLEDNIRQLTSILQAMTTLDKSKASVGLDENKNDVAFTSKNRMNTEIHMECHPNPVQNVTLGPNSEEQVPDKDLMTAEEKAHASIGRPPNRAPISPNNNKSDIMGKDNVLPEPPLIESGVAKQISNTGSLKNSAEDLDSCVKRKETTSRLEKDLLQLNVEKEKLDIELSRMPFNSAGKTVAQRQRRKYVETRLDEISKNISYTKRQLRHLNAL